MLRTATRLIAAATVMFALVVGAQPAQAAPPVVEDGTNGWLCTIIKIRCP